MAERRTVKRSAARRELLNRLQLAGIFDKNGGLQIGRPIDTMMVVRPQTVRLDEIRGVLRYETRDPLVMERPRPELLDAFVSLADASVGEIWRFAQRFGVLDVEAFLNPGDYEERLDDWRRWSARARAILGVAGSLYQGKLPEATDWDRLGAATESKWTRLFRNTDLPPTERKLAVAQRCVGDVLNELLTITQVRPCFTWWWTRSSLTLTNLAGFFDDGSLTLSGALAVQLGLACARAESIVICSGCRLPYVRHWHSSTGRRNYCKQCGIRAAWRDSKRVQRTKSYALKRSTPGMRKKRDPK